MYFVRKTGTKFEDVSALSHSIYWMSEMHQNSSSLIFQRARSLRSTQTKAEKILWSHLRNRKLNGLKFRRQHPILSFIADFYCHELRLIIEVDGEVHHQAGQQSYDQRRQKELEISGIKMIRICNSDIIENCNTVLENIRNQCS
jgi:very-short-patch-repair endonuclease